MPDPGKRFSGNEGDLEFDSVRLSSVADADKAMKNHIETTHYFDEETGNFYEPTDVPPDPRPDEDD